MEGADQIFSEQQERGETQLERLDSKHFLESKIDKILTKFGKENGIEGKDNSLLIHCGSRDVDITYEGLFAHF